MFEFARSIVAAARVFFRSRGDTALEVLALRQQVAVLKRKRPRPALHSVDRLVWTILSHVWPRWRDVRVLVDGSNLATTREQSALVKDQHANNDGLD